MLTPIEIFYAISLYSVWKRWIS